MNNLQVYKLPKNNIEIKTNDIGITSPVENNPLFSLGYHFFIKRTRDAMSITDKLETKNDFYYVVNQYEPEISNYEDSINVMSKIYLKEEVKNREFYCLWEIFTLFDIASDDNMKFLILNNENEKQAIKLFREKFYTKVNKKDEINLKPKDSDLIISTKFIKNENEFLETFIDQLIVIFENQNSKGNLVLKITDTFTMPSIKLIYLITSMYTETYLYKPLFSRPTESEKYLICKNFISKENKKILKLLEDVKKLFKSKENISDIFLDMQLPNDFINFLKFTNIKFVNQQQILINEIIKYIKDNNYFGDKYHEFRNQQIESTKWWLTHFYPPTNNLYINNKEKLSKLLKSTFEKNNLEKDKFIEQLI
jgi:hypothetical protein